MLASRRVQMEVDIKPVWWAVAIIVEVVVTCVSRESGGVCLAMAFKITSTALLIVCGCYRTSSPKEICRGFGGGVDRVANHAVLPAVAGSICQSIQVHLQRLVLVPGDSNIGFSLLNLFNNRPPSNIYNNNNNNNNYHRPRQTDRRYYLHLPNIAASDLRQRWELYSRCHYWPCPAWVEYVMSYYRHGDERQR